MRIVNREAFLSMPEGTVYAKYSPQYFHSIKVKGETWTYDFLYAELTCDVECEGSDDRTDKLDKYEQTGESFNLDVDGYGRDAYFDEDQLFAIYEDADIRQLISKLQESLTRP